METVATDGALVGQYLAGDEAALGLIYERYADRVFDLCKAMLHSDDDAADAFQDTFLIAARKLDGLRDPERLRPWLYSVARNQCRARIRARRRTTPSDHTGIEAAQEAVEVDMTRAIARTELAELMVAARNGLNERDKEVLDLHLRHGLEGDELAAVLGVSTQNAYKLVQRVRDRVSRSLGSLLVARHARRDCTELDAILADWDGSFSPLIRKRVSRHVDDCETCSRNRKALFDPAGLASAMPLHPAPAAVRARVLAALAGGAVGAALPFEPRRWDDAGFPAPRVGRRLRALLFASALVGSFLVGAGAGVLGANVLDDPSPAPLSVAGATETTEPPAASTTLPETTVTATDTAPSTSTPPPTTTAAPATTPPTTTEVPTTTTPTTTEVPTTTTPTTTTSPSTSTTTTTTSTTTTTTTIPLPPPSIVRFTANAARIWEQNEPQCPIGAVGATTVDLIVVLDGDADRVAATWSDADGDDVDLTPVGSATWRATVGPYPSGTFPDGATITPTAVAYDAAGNPGPPATLPRSIIVSPCP